MNETYIGGATQNWHRNDKRRSKFGNDTFTQDGSGCVDLGRDRRDPHEGRNERDRRVIQDVVRANVITDETVLYLDSAPLYNTIAKELKGRHIVNHNAGEYVTELSHGTNKAENFFSQLKRSIDGTHHCISHKHLKRYRTEFAFRHSTHGLSDTERMVRLMSQVPGIRLSYRPFSPGITRALHQG